MKVLFSKCLFKMYIKYYFILVYVSCCAAKRSEQSNVFLSVTVNGEDVIEGDINSKETINYKLGDNLVFSCRQGTKANWGKTYFYMEHQHDGLKVTIPIQSNMTTENLSYTITGDAVYNESEVHCIMAVKGTTYLEGKELTKEKRISMTLIMSSVRTSNDSQIREVSYNEDEPPPPCRRPESAWPLVFTRKIVDGNNFNVSALEELPSKTPDNYTIIVCCDIIHFKYSDVTYWYTILNFTREIRDKTKYVYKRKSFFSPTQAGIVMGIVIMACIAIIVGIVLCRNKKNRPPDVTPSLDHDTNIYARPNQVIYAQLQLAEGTGVHQNSYATPYAQIVGFLSKN